MKQLVASIALTTLIGIPTARAEEKLQAPLFDELTIYRPAAPPSCLALFVSGDGGWRLGVVGMANEVANEGALVVGIDIKKYLRGISGSQVSCVDFAADLKQLAEFVTGKYSTRADLRRILIGYSSGATLVYAALAQASPGTFTGAISMGFCPDMLTPKPVCKGHGLEWTSGPSGKGILLSPAKRLENPWIAFQGDIDQVCFAQKTEAYVKEVPRGELVLLPHVGHGYGVEKHWLPQFKDVFGKLLGIGGRSK